MSVKTDYCELEKLAQRGRWLVISTVAASGAGFEELGEDGGLKSLLELRERDRDLPAARHRVGTLDFAG